MQSTNLIGLKSSTYFINVLHTDLTPDMCLCSGKVSPDFVVLYIVPKMFCIELNLTGYKKIIFPRVIIEYKDMAVNNIFTVCCYWYT